MNVSVIAVGHLPQELAHDWVQHLRDFDTSHPGCHFQIGVVAPDATMEEMFEALRVDPPFPIMKVQRGKQ